MQRKNYSEKELINILYQLSSALLYIQDNYHISHRDIKPQNVLVFSDGKYKLADFGEAKEAKVSRQINTLRGTELYMSPALYNGLKHEKNDVSHNPFKSDVFSLGFCFLYASALNFNLLYQVRDISDSKSINIILHKFLKKFYSEKLIQLLACMLEIDEGKRYDFNNIKMYIENNYSDFSNQKNINNDNNIKINNNIRNEQSGSIDNGKDINDFQESGKKQSANRANKNKKYDLNKIEIENHRNKTPTNKIKKNQVEEKNSSNNTNINNGTNLGNNYNINHKFVNRNDDNTFVNEKMKIRPDPKKSIFRTSPNSAFFNQAKNKKEDIIVMTKGEPNKYDYSQFKDIQNDKKNKINKIEIKTENQKKK